MPELMNELTSAIQETLAYTTELEKNPPYVMADAHKRNLVEFNRLYRAAIRTRQHDRYQATMVQIKADKEKVVGRVAEGERRVREIDASVRAGRLDPEEARKNLTRVFRQIKEDRAVLDVLDASVQQA